VLVEQLFVQEQAVVVEVELEEEHTLFVVALEEQHLKENEVMLLLLLEELYLYYEILMDYLYEDLDA